MKHYPLPQKPLARIRFSRFEASGSLRRGLESSVLRDPSWLLVLGCLASACGEGDRPRQAPTPPRPEVPQQPVTEVQVSPQQLTSLLPGLGGDELCAALQQDLGEANLIARRRFALLQSAARVEVTLGEFVVAPGPAPYAVAAHVERVGFGPALLEGLDTAVPLPPSELAGYQPGRYLLGLSRAFPPRSSSAGRGLWQEVTAWIPIAEAAPYADLFTYAVPSSAQAAVIAIDSVDQETNTARVVVQQSLAGDLPSHIAVSWDAKNRELNFPLPGPTPYVMTFSASDGRDDFRSRFSDFRPWDDDARERVTAGLAAPIPVADARALADWAEAYRTAWAFHAAPGVVAARVSGYGVECCSSEYTIHVSHEVTVDFKSSLAVSHLLFNRDDLEGLKPSQWPQCGDTSLLALLALDTLEPAPAELDAACELSALAETARDLRTADSNVRARLPDTALAREQLAQWVNAPDPVYLLASDTEAREPAALAENAFWSQPLSWEQTLAVASLQALRVQSVTRPGERSEVIVEFPNASGSLTRRLSSSCMDPRLLREGSTWLAPVMTDDPSYYEPGQAPSFIVPGWLFPASGPP